MPLDHNAVRDAIANAIAATDEDETYSAEQLKDIAFHLTDWLDDLERYYEYCRNPSALLPDEATMLLMQFLYHVPNHIAAAGKLYLDSPVRDIFGVGAVETEEGRPK